MKAFKLDNPIKNYVWGSTDYIPHLFSQGNPEKKPFAEVWMGANAASSSTAVIDGREHSLRELIRTSPEELIGKRCENLFGDTLPFLFKLLAAEKPLSIQAHPNKTQAADGWRRENDSNIPLDAENRNYKDENHKPEIICALTHFRALCGFREAGEIRSLMDIFNAPSLKKVRNALDVPSESDALQAFLLQLNSLLPKHKRELGEFARGRAEFLKKSHAAEKGLWSLIEYLASLESEDSTIIAPLFLNYIELMPGQAVFLPAGILHAYLGGFGVELMANSDNVLRGGLTKKHIDTNELLKVLHFEHYNPKILSPIKSESRGLEYYETPAEEFRLHVLEAENTNEARQLPASSPSIAIVIDGEFEVRCGDAYPVCLRKGESAFVAASADAPVIEGSGLAYIASVPV